MIAIVYMQETAVDVYINVFNRVDLLQKIEKEFREPDSEYLVERRILSRLEVGDVAMVIDRDEVSYYLFTVMAWRRIHQQGFIDAQRWQRQGCKREFANEVDSFCSSSSGLN